MFGRYGKEMTEWSNHLIDWSRAGELIKSGTHRYSKNELLIRGSVFAFATAGAFLGGYLNDSKRSNYSNATMALAGGLMGFALSHTIVMLPLIYKRYNLRQDSMVLHDEIEKVLSTSQVTADIRQAVKRLVDHIDALSLSTEQHGNASMTWSRRKDLLGKVLQKLKDSETKPDFWERDSAQVVLDLTQGDNKPSLTIN